MSIPDLLRFEKPRKGQDKMIRDMRSALSQAKSIILNAPTGMGKTDASLAASIPVAMEKDLTVIFLTPKTSQHRIVVDALQGINRKFGYGIQYVDMVGKRNLCVNEKVNGIDSDAFYLACNEAVKKGKCIFYKRARDKANITSDIAASASGGHLEMLKACSDNGLCAYEVSAELAKSARVIIADYAHILNPYTRAAFMKRISQNLEKCIVIWDEAHNIVEHASAYLSMSISIRGIRSAEEELAQIGKSIDLSYLEFVINKVSEKIPEGSSECFISKEDLPEEIVKGGKDLAESLEEAGLEYVKEGRGKRTRLMGIARFLRAIDIGQSSVMIASRLRGNVTLSINNLYPDESLGILRQSYANVMMSGTFLPLSMHREMLMLEDAVSFDYASPFPKENRLCFVDMDITSRFSERSVENYRKTAEEICRIKRSVDGNVAVFFPSFEYMKNVNRYLEGQKVYFQRREMPGIELERMLNSLKGERDALLFAVMGGSLSEGVDYPNNIIKFVVIVGIPLPKPTLILNAKKEYIDRRFDGKGMEYVYTIPAIIRAMQAAGRAIRSEKDRAVILLMDKRYSWGSYKAAVNNFVQVSESRMRLEDLRDFFAGR